MQARKHRKSFTDFVPDGAAVRAGKVKDKV